MKEGTAEMPLEDEPKLTTPQLETLLRQKYPRDRYALFFDVPDTVSLDARRRIDAVALDGKKNSVWHYRLFCDPAWSPILPRGEVYSKEFTERGWMSFSDLRAAHAAELAKLEPQAGEQ